VEAVERRLFWRRPNEFSVLAVESANSTFSAIIQMGIPADRKIVRHSEQIEKPSGHEIDEILDRLRAQIEAWG
jgi:hypothetical protein